MLNLRHLVELAILFMLVILFYRIELINIISAFRMLIKIISRLALS
jgi:hypothetical protein